MTIREQFNRKIRFVFVLAIVLDLLVGIGVLFSRVEYIVIPGIVLALFIVRYWYLSAWRCPACGVNWGHYWRHGILEISRDIHNCPYCGLNIDEEEAVASGKV
jgi:hypothetical protein